MTRVFKTVALFFVLFLCCAGSAFAISVIATPPSVTLGNSVTVTVNSLVNVNTCSINVNYGDGNSDAISCAGGTICTGILSHVYAASGPYTISATDGGGCTVTTPLPPGLANVTVSCPALSITTAALPGGIVGQPYRAQLSSSGGIAPTSWGIASLSLPDGLTLSPTGLISGVPTTYGVSNVVFGVTDSCVPTPTYTTGDKIFSINVASPATADLTITRIQLSFDNGRAETTVSRNQPGLRANADLRFNGSGLLEGYWEVDGRILAQVNQHLTYGKSIRLTSPAVPFLPTFVEGTHRVRLVITSPANEIPFPEAIYYVTGEDSAAGAAPLRTTSPRNHAELDFAGPAFQWNPANSVSVYLIEIFAKEGEDPIAAAYTRELGYALPKSILAEHFTPGNAYYWWVKGYDAEGNLVRISELSRFIFK